MVEYNHFTYNDTTFLFNCFTDEVCSVTEDGIIPKWKLDLGEDKADSRCFLNNLKELFWEEQYKILRTLDGNRDARTLKIMAENSKLAELTFDNSYLHMLLTKGVFYTLMYAYLVLCKKRRILTNKEAIVLISLFAVAFMEVIFLKYMVMIVMGYIHNRENADNGS